MCQVGALGGIGRVKNGCQHTVKVVLHTKCHKMKTKTLTFFALESPEGQELASAITYDLGPKYGFTVQVKTGAAQNDFFKAALADDVVVADASLLGEENHNYSAFTMQHISFDHILMVSRTYVPLNMIAMQEGGMPPYPVPVGHPEGLTSNQGAGFETWSNRNIVAWLDERLSELQTPREEKIAYKEGETGFELYDTYLPAMQKAMERAEIRKRKEYQVFISYRSRYIKEVEALAGQLEAGAFHNGVSKKALFLPPGSLAYETELISKMRRWMLLAIIDRRLACCDELIIYNSHEPEDPSGNYLNSWWTQGELITIAYRRAGQENDPLKKDKFNIKVSLYDPATGILSSGEHLVPKMSEEQAARMARYYAHSDPFTLGPENVQGLRILKAMFDNRWLGWFFKRQFKRKANNPRFQEMMRKAYPIEKMTEGSVNTEDILSRITDFQQFEAYINDEVYSDAFLYDVIYETGIKQQAPDMPPDIDDFLSMDSVQYRSFTLKELESAPESILDIAPGNQLYLFDQAAPRCIWHPTRRGKVRKECFEVFKVYMAYKV